MVSAKVISDSVSPEGVRLTTVQATFHRYVLAEMNTHRIFSRNSASSRAIPVAKQIKKIRETPAYPVEYGENQPGMQAGVGLNRGSLDIIWVQSSRDSADTAEKLMSENVHKQVTNRLLEPFMWHTAVISSTAWGNFFNQRCSPLAQPEIRVVAEMIREVMDDSKPAELGVGEWHLPYIQDDEYVRMDWETLKKVSTARCARVSYLTQEGSRDYSEDIKLYARLVSSSPMHASPLEHVATPAAWNSHTVEWTDDQDVQHTIGPIPKVGNFLGFQQHRLEVEQANKVQSFT